MCESVCSRAPVCGRGVLDVCLLGEGGGAWCVIESVLVGLECVCA